MLLLLGLGACSLTPTEPEPPAKVPERPAQAIKVGPLAVTELPGWSQDTLHDVMAALRQQCAMANPPGPWKTLCLQWRNVAPETLRPWIETRFSAWAVVGPKGDQGLITGYYEPLLTGSRTRESLGQVPLYVRPADLVAIDLAGVEPRLSGLRLRGRIDGQRVVPYYSRAQIEVERPLLGQELLWADDPIEAFFLEIQGSGRVQLRDGTLVRIGYADQNGHPYRAIGRTLIERGALEPDGVSAQSIKQWLRDHPAEAPAILRSNPSQVFFRELPALPLAGPGEPEPGPPGSLGVPLTPLRSLAVDRRHVPLGSLVYLDTVHPVDGRPLQQLMAAQDTGGAITGAVRADFFWGFGPAAEEAAGKMKSPGRLWLLWPKGDTPPGG